MCAASAGRAARAARTPTGAASTVPARARSACRRHSAAPDGLAQRGDDVALDRLGRVSGGVAAAHRPVAVDQELGKVPLDRLAAQEARLLRLEVGVERVGVGAVHLDLGEDREAHAVGERAELADRGGVAGLLGAELIARKAKDDETVVLVAPVQLLKPGVLRGEAAATRDVDDQQHLAAIVGHGLGCAVQKRRREGVYAHGFVPRYCSRFRQAAKPL